MQKKLALQIARASESCSWRCISYIFTGRECQMTGQDLVFEAKKLLGDDYEIGRYCRNCVYQCRGTVKGELYSICSYTGSEFYRKRCPNDGCNYFCKNINKD